MLEVGVGGGYHHSLLVGLQTGTATMETSVENSQNSLKKNKLLCEPAMPKELNVLL